MFKKFISLFLTLLLTVALAACSKPAGREPERDISLQDMLTQIQSAYGEGYLLNTEIPHELLEAEFGLTEDMYVEAVAEQPLMSTHPDRVVLVKAADGRAGDVEAAFEAARLKKIGEELQYPINIPKTNAAKVVRNGNYVAFLLVGTPLDEFEVTEQDMIDYYEAEVAKAVDIFHASFQ